MIDALSMEIQILKKAADTASWEAQRCESLLREAEIRFHYAEGHHRQLTGYRVQAYQRLQQWSEVAGVVLRISEDGHNTSQAAPSGSIFSIPN